MTIAQRLGQLHTEREMKSNATDFARLAHALLKYGTIDNVVRAINQPHTLGDGLGHLGDIVRHAGMGRITRVDLQTRAAQNPQSLGVDAAFQNYVAISNGFLGSLMNAGAFDAMLPDMVRFPVQNATVGYVSTGATAYSLNEMDMKPLSRLSITSQNMDPLKAVCMVEFTKELVKVAPPGTLQLIEGELRKAVAKVTDERFLSVVSPGVSPNTSTGSTGTAVRADIHGMLQQVTLDQSSKPFLISNSTVLKNIVMATDRGVSCFPQLTPQGGSVNGIPWVVTDAAGTGLIYLVDAASIGANSGELILTEGQEYMRQGNDAPDSPPGASTPLVSAFQMNFVALRVERYFVVERVRSNSVAAVSNSGSWASGDSPP
jgi:hypothetical protein